MTPVETTDDGSYMLALVILAALFALFWLGVGLAIGHWLL